MENLLLGAFVFALTVGSIYFDYLVRQEIDELKTRLTSLEINTIKEQTNAN